MAAASNLLDALIQGGVPVPSGCRAGSCHACLVRCLEGEPHDLQPDLLRPEQRHAGWRLACQCRVEGDLSLEVFDPHRDGLAARVESLEWLGSSVLPASDAPLVLGKSRRVTVAPTDTPMMATSDAVIDALAGIFRT